MRYYWYPVSTVYIHLSVSSSPNLRGRLMDEAGYRGDRSPRGRRRSIGKESFAGLFGVQRGIPLVSTHIAVSENVGENH